MTTTTDSDFTAREALRLLGRDPENWVPDRPGIDHNVTIIELADPMHKVITSETVKFTLPDPKKSS